MSESLEVQGDNYISVTNLLTVPEDLFLELIFPQLTIKLLMQIKHTSKQIKYLIEKYQKICNDKQQIKPRHIDKISTLFPKLNGEIIIKHRAKIVANNFSCIKSLTFHRSSIISNLAKFTSLEKLILYTPWLKNYNNEFDNISSLTNLKYLDVDFTNGCSANILKGIPALYAAIPNFINLDHLLLNGIGIDFDCLLLSKLVNLSYLYIDHNKQINTTFLLNLTKLTSLCLRSSPSQSLIEIDLAKIPKLAELILFNYNITGTTNLSNLTSFEYINIYNREHGLLKKLIYSMTNVTTLYLSYRAIDLDLEPLEKIKHLTLGYIKIIISLPINIERLTMYDIYENDHDIYLTTLTKLKYIYLSDCSFPIYLPKHYIKKKIIENCQHVMKWSCSLNEYIAMPQ